ncbi:SRPBCC family protein [Paenibacillus donghaensis]|uniref:Polyketide cyclase n=1 Tax=Paenibacillus donghaensis TaxID=414771 RepID=A0A2Z2KJG2_9BACL|nr:SRPBCC domain-containing protein [Paenibacillus donghaensis]ASA22449.1 polyketide cyclase [Paenibacillus donghaensis]
MSTKEESNELVITRELAAPRDLVFKVWSEAEHLKNWWGPTGFKFSVVKLDFRPRGVFHYRMQTPDGDETMWGKFVYVEMEQPEKIVFVNSFADAEGNTIRAPFSAVFPLEIRNEVTFTEANGTTTMTLRGGPIHATDEEQQFYVGMFESMKQGFGGTFDQLEAYLAKI